MAKGFVWPAAKRETEEYKNELFRQADEKVKLSAAPSKEDMERFQFLHNAREVWARDVIRAHPKALWIEGCEGPRIKDFEVRLRIKPDTVPKAAQPIPFGEFDQLRADFLVEEEVALGKWVYYNPEVHHPPEWLSALFVVDQ